MLAAVAGLTFGLTGLASDTEQSRQRVPAAGPPGRGGHQPWGPTPPLDRRRCRAAAPGPRSITQNLVFDTRDPSMTGDGDDPDRALPGRLPQRRATRLHRGERTVRDDELGGRAGGAVPRGRGRGTLDTLEPSVAPCSVGGTSTRAAARSCCCPSTRSSVASGSTTARRMPSVPVRSSPATFRRAPRAGRRSRIARGTYRRRPHGHRAGRPAGAGRAAGRPPGRRAAPGRGHRGQDAQRAACSSRRTPHARRAGRRRTVEPDPARPVRGARSPRPRPRSSSRRWATSSRSASSAASRATTPSSSPSSSGSSRSSSSSSRSPRPRSPWPSSRPTRRRWRRWAPPAAPAG